MRYLRTSDITNIYQMEIGQQPAGVDLGGLESATFRPQQTVGGRDAYPDIHTKAAALLHSLIQNHPFLDGNKRTAVLSVIAFYNLNGWAVDAEQGDVVDLALEIAHGLHDVETISIALEKWVLEVIVLPELTET